MSSFRAEDKPEKSDCRGGTPEILQEMYFVYQIKRRGELSVGGGLVEVKCYKRTSRGQIANVTNVTISVGGGPGEAKSYKRRPYA